MKVATTKELKVKLKGDDADHFRSALKKIADEQKTPGFKSSGLSQDEVDVIQKLSDKIKNH